MGIRHLAQVYSSSSLRFRVTVLTFLLALGTSFSAFAVLPRAHHLYISGTTAGANPATYSAMEVGFTLRVWYTYADPDGQVEAGSTFQWYTFTDEFGGGKTAIAGATANTFLLTAAQQGLYIGVEVRPRNAVDGFGAIVEFRAFTATNKNLVLPNANSCNKAGGGVVGPGNNLDTTTPLCSPRNTTWQVFYTGIDHQSTAGPKIFLNFGDGGGFVSFNPTLSNALLTKNDTINLTNESNQLWVTTQAHTYDYAGGSAPSGIANQACTYTLQATWGRGVAGCAASGLQTQPFTVWDKENNASLGTFDINKDPTSAGVETGEITDICQGDQSAVRLLDNSDFNCTAAGAIRETIRENDEARWVQWVYGTASTITTGAGATEKIIINGVSYTSAQLPIYGRVTYQASPTTAPLPAITDNIQMPTSANVGETMIVTLRSWNTCNPLDRNVADGNGFNPPQGAPFNVFDITRQTSGLGTNQPGLAPQFPTIPGPAIFANNAPVLRTYTIRIMAKPVPLTTAGRSMCFNDPTGGVNFTVASSIGGARTAVNWFKDYASAVAKAPKMTNPNGTNSLNFPVSSYAGQGGIGGAFTTNNANGKYYSVWVTQVAGGSNNCESNPIEVVIYQQPDITGNVPAVPAGSTSVCNGPPGTLATYTEATAPPTKTIPITTATNGAAINLPTENFWTQGFGAGVSLSTTTGNSTDVTYNIAAQPNPSTTNNISVALRYQSTNVSVVSPVPTTPVPTYTIATQLCTTNPANLAVTVFGQSNGGTTSPASQTICEGAAITNISLAGQRGSVTSWEKSVNGAAFLADGTLGVATTISPSVPIIGGVQTNYRYRAVVVNGPCAAATSTIATIIVNPKPTNANLIGGATMCQGASTNLRVNITGGTSPYTVVYNDGSGNTTLLGYVSGTNIPVSPATTRTYTLVSVTDAAGCTPTTLTGSSLVTISNPTNAVISGTQSICSGATANIAVTITGGVSPYTVKFTDGVVTTTVNNYTSGNPITVGPLVASKTYTLLGPVGAGVVGADGCPVLAQSGSAVITVGSAITVATFAGGGSVCQGLPKNLTLTITGGVSPYTLTSPQLGIIAGYTSGSNIPVPTGAVGTINYTVSVVTDACGFSFAAPAIAGNPQAVTVNALPTANNQTPTVCSTTAGGTTAVVDLTALQPAINPGAMTFTWYTGYNAGTKLFSGPIAVPTAATVTNAVSVFAEVRDGNSCVSPATVTYTVNPRPNPPTSPVNSTFCSVPGTPAAISVANPGAGLTIDWYAAASGGAPLAGGTGTLSFIPPAAGTYFAETRNSATGCVSTSRISAVSTMDTAPSAAAAGPDQTSLCSSVASVNLAATAVNNGGTGTWTVPGKIAYFQNFASFAAGTTSSTALNGWTRDVTDPESFAGGQGYFQVQGGRFEGHNTNGSNGNGVALMADVIWASPVVDITGMSNVQATVDLINMCSGGELLDGGADADYVQVFFKLNGGANTNFNTNGLTLGNGAAGFSLAGATLTATAFAAPTTGTSLQIFVKMSVNANNERIAISKITIKDNTSAIAFSDANNPTASVTGIPGPAAGAAPVSTTLRWTASSSLGACTPSTDDVVITLNPAPLLAAGQVKTVCSGTAVNHEILLSPLNFPAGTTFSWPLPVMSDASVQGTSQVGIPMGVAGTPHITDVLTNTTGANITATYTITPTSGFGCVGTPATVVVTVRPAPRLVNPQTKTICSGQSVNYEILLSPANLPAGTSFTWPDPDGGGPATGKTINADPAGTKHITDILTNVGVAPITVTYSITPTGPAPGNCVGTVRDVVVTVNPLPVANPIVGSTTVCSGPSIILYQVTPHAGSTYNWTVPPLFTKFAGGTPADFFVLLQFNSVGSGTISVTETNSFGCAGSPNDLTINVASAPGALAINGASSVCTNDLGFVYQVASPTPNSVYSWTVSGATINGPASGTNLTQITVDFGLITPVTVQVTETSSSGCVGSPASKNVVVNTRPVMTSTNTNAVCSGGVPSLVFTASQPSTFGWRVTSITGTITNVAVNQTGSGDLSSTFTGASALRNTSAAVGSVTFDVTPTSTAAPFCVGATQSVVVTVNPVPAIPAQTATICSGGTFTITPVDGMPTAATIVPSATTYTWLAPVVTGGVTGGSAQGAPQASISQTLTNPTNAVQTATYTVTPTSGASGSCVGSPFTVTVTINPKPAISNQTATICSGGTFSITPTDGVPTIATIVPAGTLYSWPAPVVTGGITGSSAAVNQASISQTLVNPTNSSQVATYTVTPSTASCTGATFTVTVTVNPQPVIANQTATICSGGTFTINPTNGGATIVPAGTTYSWAGPVVTGGITGGSAQVAQPTISQTLTNPTNAVQTATYTVVPTSGAAGACVGAAFTVTVTVNPAPVIPNQTATICSGSAFTIAPANGIPTAATIVPASTTYTWPAPVVTGGITGGSAQAVGQPSISQTLTNPTNSTQTATYTVTPTSGASGSCVGATFTITVTVNPVPVIPAQTATICSGGTFTVTPANGVPTAATIVPAATTYSWPVPVVTGGITGGSAQAGQASISQTLTNPTNTAQTATYTVTPTSGAAGACVGTAFTVTVTVNPQPVIGNQTATICSGGTFTISPTNGGATIVPAGTTYTWAAPVVTGGITGASAQTGQANISQTLTNPTNTVQTATYTVTPTSGAAGACVGANFTVTVTVNPKPVIANQTATICSGGTFTITPADGVPTVATIVPAGTTYAWAAPVVTGGITGGSAQAAQPNISQTLTNPTNTPQTATYTVTPTSGASGACVGANFTVTVTVNPQPVIGNQTATICSGGTFTIAPANGGATIVPTGTTYTWPAPVVTGGVTGASAQAAQINISQTLTNPTNVVQTVTYTVTPTSGDAGACVGAPFTVTVTVDPKPVIPAQAVSICSGAAFTVNPTDGVPTAATIVPVGTTYSWPAPVVTGGITGASAQVNQAAISQTLTNPTNTAQTATYTVTPTSGAAGACVGATFTVTVTVNPVPAIAAQTAAICSGGTFTVTPVNGVPTAATVVPGGTTYTWPAPVVTGGITGGSAQAVGVASISQTLVNPTNLPQTATYTVTPTSGASGSCVGAAFTVTVTVNPVPAIPNQTATICSGSSFSITPANGVPTAATIVPGATTYTWLAPVVTGGLTGGSAQSGQLTISQTLTNPTNTVQTATYTVTPTSGASGGCVGSTFTVTVTVNPMPAVPAQTVTICSGATFNVTPVDGVPTAATIVPAGTTYSWPAPVVTGGITGGSAQAGQASISQTLTNPTNTAQIATYTVTPTAGTCTGTAFTVLVTVNPMPTIPNQSATVCSGAAFSITPANGVPTGATIVPVGTTYTWTAPFVTGGMTGGSAQAAPQTSISQTLTNPTNAVQTATYTVTPTTGTCVGATFDITVTVNPKPVIPAQTATICSGGTFTITPADGVPTAATIVPAGTTYTWTAPVVTGGVTGGSAQAVGQPNISQTLTNPTNVPQTATYTVTPTSGAAGACVGSTFTVTVTVNPQPVIAAQTATICSGGTFTVTPANGVPTAATIVPAGTTYTWTAPVVTGGITGGSAQAVGQPNISQTLTNPTNTAQTATYTVTPTSGAAGACVGATFTVTVTVNPVPAIPAQVATICSAGTFSITPANGGATIVPAGTTYTWLAPVVTGGLTGGSAQSNQASISQTLTNPTNTTQTATYTVTPATASCTGATFTVTVTVDPKPAIPAQSATICSGGTFTITPVDGVPTAATIVPGTTLYTWTAPVVTGGITGGSAQAVGQPNISQTLTNPTNSVQSATYTVTPTAGACVGSTFTLVVTVNPVPVVPAQSATICSGATFTVSPTNGVPTAATIVPGSTTYSWPAPVVTGGITGGTAQNNQPSISETLVNPTNTPQSATYTVTPTSGAAGSCIGAAFVVTVTVNPKPVIPAQTATICSGGTFTITPADGVPTAATIVPAGTTYTWTAPVVTGGVTGGSAQAVGQPNISQTLTNPTNVPQTATYTVTPTSGAAGACVGSTFSVTVTVNPQPVIAAQTSTICSGGTFTVTPANGVPTAATIVPAGTTYTWTAPVVTGGITGGSAQAVGQPNISQTLTNPTNTAQTATYTVTPTSGAAGACVGATFTVTVTVNPVPAIPAQVATICSAGTFSITPANGGATIVPAGTTYTWTNPVVTGGLSGGSAQGVGQTSISQTLTNPTNTTQTATYTVTPATASCTGATFTVTVTVDPKPAIPAQSATICSGGTFTVTPIDGVPNAATIVPGTTLYTWTAPVVTGGITGGSAQAVGQPNISQTLTNPTNSVQSATYTVTPTAGACVGSTFTLVVTVNPTPVIGAQSASVCSGSAFTVSPVNGVPTAATIVPGGTTYTWTAPLVTGGITGGTAQAVPQPNISQTLVNPTNVVQTATYTVTPVSGSCTGATFTVTINVNPQPVIPAQTASMCSGTAFSVSPVDGFPTAATIVPAGTTYAWTAPVVTGGITGGSAQIGQATISQTLVNPTNVNQTATYTVTPTSGATGACVGPTFTVTVTVNPVPAIPAQTATICSGGTFTVTPNNGTPTAATIVPAGTTYTWTAPAVTGGITGGSAQAVGQPNISQTLTNPTNIPQTATYTVTPTSGAAGSCMGASFTLTVTVNPQPVIADQTATACSGDAFSVTPANGGANVVPAGTTYSWTIPVVTGGLTGGSAQSGQTSISQTLSNPTNAAQTATYTVTPTSGAAGTCVGATFTVTVTVNPRPVAQALSQITRCSGQAINFDLQDIINNVAPYTGGNSVASNFTYTVLADFPLDVIPAVFPGTFDRTVASNAPISNTFSNLSGHDVTLTYTVTAFSVIGNCPSTPFTFKVVYHPEPVGSNFNEPNCNTSLSHNIQTQITNGVTSTFTYTISQSPVGALALPPDRVVASNAPITDSYTNLTGSPVVVTYTITAFNATFPTCQASGTFTYNVTISPKPVGVSDTKAAVCSDVAFSIDPQSNIVPAVPSTFTWTATYDGSPIPGGTGNLAGSFTNTSNTSKDAVFTVIPTAVGSGCVGPAFTVTVPINPEPVMDPALANPSAVCSTNAISSNPIGVVLGTNGVSVTANQFTVTLKSQDAGLVGTPTVGTFAAAGGFSTAIQNDTYRNTSATTLKVVYTVVPQSAAGCNGDAFDINVSINPEPVVNPVPNTVCSTDITNIVLSTNGTSVGASSYNLVAVTVPGSVTADPGNITPGTTAGVNLIKNDKYTNVSSAAATVIYEIRAISASGCTGVSDFINVTINPGPVLDPLLSPSPACSGLPSGVILGVAAGSVAAASYNINSILFPGLTAGPSNLGIGTNKPANYIVNDSYINVTNAPLTVTYNITPVSAAGCLGPQGTVTLTINPSPDLANNLNRTVCSGVAGGITLAISNSVAMGDFTLNTVTVAPGLVAGGGNATPGAGKPANALAADVFSNPTNGPLTVTYNVTPRSSASCDGPAEDVILTIEPSVIAAPLNLKPAICSNSSSVSDPTDIQLVSPTTPTSGVITFNYTAALTAGSSTSGFIASGLTNLPQNYHIQDDLVNSSNAVATVTYTITPVANGARAGLGCTGTPVLVSVNVEPKPRLNPSTTVKTVCNAVGPAITLNSPTVPSTGAIEFVVTNVNAPGTVTGASAVGTIFANGSQLNDILTSTSTNVESVVYTLRPRMTAGAGCVGDDVTITINVNPQPTASAAPVAPICSGDQITVPLTLPVLGTVATWTVGPSTPNGTVTGAVSGAGDQIIAVLFNNAGTTVETVTYVVTPKANGCNGTPINITVQVSPVAKVTGTPTTTTICHGGTLNVPLSSNVPGATFDWTVSPNSIGVPLTGSGNVINQPMSNTTGVQETLTYTITPTTPGLACVGQSKIMIVTVAPEITAGWLSPAESICKGSTEYLVFQFGGQPPFDFTYEVNGVPTTVLNKGPVVVIQHVPTITTTYTITSVTSHVGGTTCTTAFNIPLTITVGDTDPNWSIISPTATCSPNQVSFQYNQVAGTIYTWRFGDTADSVYTATTTVPNKVIKHTYVNLSPTATLTYPVSMQTELPPPFPGCLKSTPPKSVTIYPQIIPNVLSDKTVICSGESVLFMNQSVGATSQTWSYKELGSPGPETLMGTSVNISQVFNNLPGQDLTQYDVIYRGTNGNCPTPDQHITITVNHTPDAVITPGAIPLWGAAPTSVTLTNSSTPLNGAVYTYDWLYGSDANPIGATTAAPTVTADYYRPGQKTVTLTVTNNANPNCKDVDTKTYIINYPPLTAAFTLTPDESCAPAVISTSMSAATFGSGDSYDWRVIDQNGRTVATSTSDNNPQFNIPMAGDYTVTLTVSRILTGQSVNAVPQTFTVYGQPFASFDVRPDVVYVPNTELTTFNFSNGATNYLWDFGDGTTETDEEATHTYKVEGQYDITLIAMDDHGNGIVCMDTLKRQVTAKQGGVTKVPNAFTPNPFGPSGGSTGGGGGSGGTGSFNDVFLPIVKGAEEFNLQIFDRWGNLIFESNSSQVGWDGYDKNGKLLPSGVYVYKLTVRLSDGQRSTQIGDVTMIR